MTQKTITTDKAPKAVGPYSQAIEAGGFIYVSGQLGLSPTTQKLVPGGVGAQAERVIDNIEVILAAAGAGLTDVVKTTVLLADMNDFQSVNSVYAARFGDHRPARAAFAVKALPLGALVEIETVAYVGR